MPKPEYLHSNETQNIIGGKKMTEKIKLVDGPAKGLSYRYLFRKNQKAHIQRFPAFLFFLPNTSFWSNQKISNFH